MEHELVELYGLMKGPFYVISFTPQPDGVVQTKVLAKVSDARLGDLIVHALPSIEGGSVEVFGPDEFTRTLEPGETW
jgi:hypothetical protein